MHLVAVLEASWAVLGASWVQNGGQHGSNLAPKTEQKSEKNEAKNDQNLNASWDHFFRDVGGFEEVKYPSWYQIRTINRLNFKNKFIEQKFFPVKNNDFEGAGGRSCE